ncbi:MAG: NrdH-redoxin [Acidobacteria bacterium]|jgi:glutaredoxin 3|nr:MAG: NrdH-redoxin [Acidobacteriota bacterium]PYV77107.1 MAG: NrdH-redoxin [Acidobacteriota bacterium]
MFCNQAKEYLSQKGIQFQEKDIAQDPDALADLKKLGYMTTPVIVIDGSVIVGFDADKIEQALRG